MQPQSNVVFERRSKSRFPLRLSVRYRTVSGGPALVGVGRTVNISSRGLLIASEQPQVTTGARLQLTVDWPPLLHGITPLQLVVYCRVTRCFPEEFAVEMDQYQFRTKRAKPAAQRPPEPPPG